MSKFLVLDFQRNIETFAPMTEKIQINGQEIWIVVESHITPMAGDERKEYFTASYHPIDPVIDPAGDTFWITNINLRPSAHQKKQSITRTKNCWHPINNRA